MKGVVEMKSNCEQSSVRWGLSALALAMAAQSGIANASEAGRNSDDTPKSAAELADSGDGDIIVTAQKREERLQDVPLTITSLSSEQLTSAGVVTTRDLGMVVPGVIVTNNGNSFAPTIRAISSRGVGPGDDPSVATYIDGAYNPSLFGGFSNLLDIKQVEVVKGPQGTLYGRNTTGGAVNISTREPDGPLTARALVDYGAEFNTIYLAGYVAGSISDSWSVGIAASHRQADDFVRNISPGAAFGEHGNIRDDAARIRLQYEPPGSSAKVFLTVDWADFYNEATYALVPFPFGRSQFRAVPGVVLPSSKDEISLSRKSWLDGSTLGATLNARFDIGAINISSITALRRIEGRINTDLDRTSFPGGWTTGPSKWVNFSQEINVSGKIGDKVDWIAGVFIWRSDAYIRQYIAVNDNRAITREPYDPEFAYGQPGFDRQGDVDSQSEAVFSEVTYAFTDRFSLTGGIRYTMERKDFTFRNLLTGASTVDDKSWENVSYRIVGKFRLTDDWQTYLSYGTGFKSGVYNALSQAVNLVNPEKIRAWEIGVKGTPTRQLRVSLSAFHYDYSDLQFTAWNVSPAGTSITLLNAADAKIEGAEFEVSWSGPSLVMNAGLAWTPTAKFSRFPTALVYDNNPATGGNLPVVRDISGTRMIQAPKLTANLGGTYTIPTGSSSVLLSANLVYNSGFYFGLNETAREKEYFRANGRITWVAPGERLRLSVWADNITDERNTVYANQGGPHDVFAFDRGREFGLGAEFRF